jgi:type I restriction enzyme S subunit
MVPEGWQRKPIGDVCAAIVDCVNKTAPIVDEPTPYKMIRTTNVRHGRVDTDNVRYVSKETFRIWTRRGELQDEDIILTREAPVGEVGQLRNAQGMFLGQRTMVYRANVELMDQQFLYQSMIGPSLIRQYHADSAGGTVAHIRVPDCSKFVLSVPPLPEQRKIADILSTWDQAIEKTEALLSNARTQKRALMQQLLTGKRRFPAFEGQPWKEVRLGDVISISKNRLDPKREHNARRCIEMEHIEAETGRLIGSTTSDQQASTKAVFGPGDILFGKLRPYLRKFFAPDFDGVCSTEIWVLQPKQGAMVPSFLHGLVQSEGFLEQAEKSAGSKMPRADWKIVSEYRFMLPSVGEQEAIANVVAEMGTEIDTLYDNITKLRTEKKALMQQLLTGKRRVVV